MSSPFRMTPPYDLLLRGTDATPVGLYHLQLATIEQLCRLHYSPNSVKLVEKRLRALHEAGYVQRDTIPTKQYKSPYYYTLGSAGMRYLAEIGYDTEGSWRAQKEVDKGYLHLAHTRELNDVLIAAALIAKADPRYRLHAFEHERTLKRDPLRVRLPKGQTVTLIPDVVLDFRLVDTPARLCVAIEHDRGTEEQQHFRRKVRTYIALLRSGAYQERFGAKRLTIAFTTFQGENRLKQMRAWTEQELASTKEPESISHAFAFASLPEPPTPRQVWLEPRWYMAPAAYTVPYALLAA